MSYPIFSIENEYGTIERRFINEKDAQQYVIANPTCKIVVIPPQEEVEEEPICPTCGQFYDPENDE